jgi:hypothetical protein
MFFPHVFPSWFIKYVYQYVYPIVVGCLHHLYPVYVCCHISLQEALLQVGLHV